MKKLLLITLLFLALGARAQTTKKIDSFLGIKFGSSVAAVTAAMKLKGYTPNKQLSKPTMMVFEGVKLGIRTSTILGVQFVNGKAFEASFVFDPDTEAEVIDEYDAITNNLNDVYGTGQSEKKFKSPYKDGDGDEILAITSGNAEYSTSWIDGANRIKIEITKDASVYLSYRDGLLNDQAMAKQREKNKAEY